MPKRTAQKQTEVAPLVNTSIRPRALRLAKLAAPFVNESITDFLSGASVTRAMGILKSHNVRIPADAAPVD